MFESSLLSTRRKERPRGRALGFAVIAHGAVVVGVLFAGLWSVEAVAAPPFQITFTDELPLPPPGPAPAPPAPPEQPAAQPEPPAPPAEIVQPEVVPDTPVPEPTEAPPTVASGPFDPNALPSTGPTDGVPFAPPGNGRGGNVPGGTGDEPLHIDASIDPPRVIQRVQPTYTELARRMRIEGLVVLEAIIDRTGHVTDVRVLKGLPAGLDQSAMTAVQQWRFAPATMNRRPVPVYFRLTVRFEIH
jgi:protein TonB